MTVLGLTGSIGMGKSAVAAMFRRLGVPVFDADAEVHLLQAPGGALVKDIEARFPGTTGPMGVDRQKLGAIVLVDRTRMTELEALIHPVVAQRRAMFLKRHRFRPLVVLDIPLLYEKSGADLVDAVAVVSAPAHVQRRRVLARPGMTEEKLRAILKLQMPDEEKRRLADFVIPTGGSKARTFGAIKALVARLSGRD